MNVHVWASISKRGRVALNEQWMFHYTLKLLNQTLLPFLEIVYPDGHHSMAENDLKHISKEAKD